MLASAGLHWVSRLHLVCGIFAYLAPLLWLMLVVCGAIIWPSQHLTVRSAEYGEVIAVFVFNLALLAAPKAMALTLALGSPKARSGFGGARWLWLGFAVECVASMLTTPVMMLMQAIAVAEVLIGRDSGWTPQRREGVELSGRDAWRAHRGHVLLGVGRRPRGPAGQQVLPDVGEPGVPEPHPLGAVVAAHLAAGDVRRRRLFRIPEDTSPPPVLARSLELRRAYLDEARARRQIEALFRQGVPAYEFKAARASVVASPWVVPAAAPAGSVDQLADPGLGERVRPAAQVGAQVHDLAGRRGGVEHQPPAAGLALDGIGDWGQGLPEACAEA